MRTYRRLLSFCIAASITAAAMASHADETCNSPYMSGLIKGQEDFVHVWTLGVPGWATDRTSSSRSMRIPRPRRTAK